MNLKFLRQVPKDKLQKIVLVCIVTLCAVVGVVQMYVLKNWSTLDETKAEIIKLEDQIREAEKKARQAVQDVAYREQMRLFLATQEAAMIAGDPFAWVVREISLMAEKHPVRVSGLHPGGRVESANKPKYPLYTSRIDLSGTYDQIGEFVRDLENRFPTGEIRTIAVSGNAGDEGQHQVMLELTLLMKPEPPAKKPEEKQPS